MYLTITAYMRRLSCNEQKINEPEVTSVTSGSFYNICLSEKEYQQQYNDCDYRNAAEKF